jgi:hypothetical protein
MNEEDLIETRKVLELYGIDTMIFITCKFLDIIYIHIWKLIF